MCWRIWSDCSRGSTARSRASDAGGTTSRGSTLTFPGLGLKIGVIWTLVSVERPIQTVCGGSGRIGSDPHRTASRIGAVGKRVRQGRRSGACIAPRPGADSTTKSRVIWNGTVPPARISRIRELCRISGEEQQCAALWGIFCVRSLKRSSAGLIDACRFTNQVPGTTVTACNTITTVTTMAAMSLPAHMPSPGALMAFFWERPI
jgi:hypothetical protein